MTLCDCYLVCHYFIIVSLEFFFTSSYVAHWQRHWTLDPQTRVQFLFISEPFYSKITTYGLFHFVIKRVDLDI